MRYRILLFICLLPILSCTHKELCYDAPKGRVSVNVKFVWDRAPEADPEQMSLYLYPLEGGEVERFDFSGREGGLIQINPGEYRAIGFNSDRETILLKDFEDFHNFKAYTNETDLEGVGIGSGISSGVPRTILAADDPLVLAPESFYSDAREDIKILPKADQEIVLHPFDRTMTITIDIREVKNLSSIRRMRGTLSGLNRYIYLKGIEENEYQAMIPFDLNKNGGTSLHEVVRTFAPTAKSGVKYSFSVYAWLASGARKYVHFDITDQIMAQKGEKNIHVVIDKLDIRDDGGNGGGFNASINTWEDVYSSIWM